MAVTAERVAVSTTAVALNTAGTSALRLTVKNGGGLLDLGPSNVASGAGLDVAANAVVQVELDAGDVLFAISDVTGATAQVLRT